MRYDYCSGFVGLAPKPEQLARNYPNCERRVESTGGKMSFIAFRRRKIKASQSQTFGKQQE
jgi:hypothetical protein